MKHVMLDLETWGTEPGCDIRSIGAVEFDPVNSTIEFKTAFYQAVDNPTLGSMFIEHEHYYCDVTQKWYKFALTHSESTVKWWNEQSDDAKAAFADAIDLDDGLRAFSDWYSALGPAQDVTLWCNGPHFDEVILKAVYRACNMVHPWHYRAPRDFRTEMEGAGWPELPFTGTPHNAMDDAIYQAQCVIECYQIRPPAEG